MPYETLILLIPALPIAGFVFAALFGRRLQSRFGRNAASLVPVVLVVAAWLCAMAVVPAALQHQEPFGEHGLDITLWQWIPAGAFNVDVGFHVDALTACLLIVVATIGMLVHVYSIGYMSHDPGTWRFFAYLNLFMFSMLLLVLADNFLVVFVAWELVGLSSYLLIGFWYGRRSAALASKKAFIVNRVGDVGFALGIMLIFVSLHTLNIQEVLAKIETLDQLTIGAIALLVFCGAVGKSAQFPLHVWLPDAMEGPTPVSALIHAATMVNAGVYLVARANPIFAHAQDTMLVVAAIGIFTAILAASIAFTQTDIKRVARLLDALAARLHVRGPGRRGLDRRDLPPDDPRLLQGPALPRLGLGHPRRPRGAGHAPDGRPGEKIPIDLRDDAHRLAGHRRHPAPGRLLQQGRDPRRGLQDRLYVVWLIGSIVAVMTAFYMFRLMGMTFWAEPGRPGVIREDPRVAPVDDDPARHPGLLLGDARPVPRPAARRRPDRPVAGAGLRAENEILGPAEGPPSCSASTAC